MAPIILDSCSRELGKDWGRSSGLMDHVTKECGKMTWPTEREDCRMQEEMFIKAAGREARLVDMGYTRIAMVLSI